jgi:Histidine phosphatase superfamily (branch 1)
MFSVCSLIHRFPGGESYRDLMSRLTSVVIDVEQEVVPTLVVSHVSILQCLMAYFRNSRVEQCMSIEVPLHTVIKFTPVRGKALFLNPMSAFCFKAMSIGLKILTFSGGGWSESHHPFYDVQVQSDTFSDMRTSESSCGINTNLDRSTHSESCSSLPIWGDSTMSPRPPLTKRISH